MYEEEVYGNNIVVDEDTFMRMRESIEAEFDSVPGARQARLHLSREFLTYEVDAYCARLTMVDGYTDDDGLPLWP